MIGENGAKTPSTTLYRGPDYRVDVENPSPGVRPGQLHLQDYAGNKWLWDFGKQAFKGLAGSELKRVAGTPGFWRAVAKGISWLIQ